MLQRICGVLPNSLSRLHITPLPSPPLPCRELSCSCPTSNTRYCSLWPPNENIPLHLSTHQRITVLLKKSQKKCTIKAFPQQLLSPSRQHYCYWSDFGGHSPSKEILIKTFLPDPKLFSTTLLLLLRLLRTLTPSTNLKNRNQKLLPTLLLLCSHFAGHSLS